MSRGSIYAGRAVILVTAEDQLNKGLGRIRSTLRKFSNSISNLGDSAFRGGFLGSIVSGGILKHFIDFEDKMLTLQARLGIFGKAAGNNALIMQGLEKSIRDLGKSTSYTTSQVADAAIELAQAGFSSDQIKDSLQAVLDLARGAGTDLGSAAEILANTMATFKMNASSSGRVADMFVKSLRLGTIGIEDLKESLKYASSAVVNLNEDLPVLLAFLTKMSDAGLKGSLAGTSLRTAFTQMVKQIEQMKSVGNIDIVRGIGKDGKQKIDLIKSFINVSKGLQSIADPAERLKAYADIFNLRGMASTTSIKDMDDVVQLLKDVTDSFEEARKAAETMDQGMGGSVRRATGSVSDLVIELGKIKAPTIQAFLAAIPPAVEALEILAQKNGDLVLGMIALPFALVAAGIALKGVAVALALAASATTPLISGIRTLGKLITPGTGAQLTWLLGGKKNPRQLGLGKALGQGGSLLRGASNRFGAMQSQMAERSRLRALSAGQSALARSQFKKMATLGDKGARLGGLGNERAVQTKLGVDIDQIDEKLKRLAKARKIAADAARVEAMYQKDLTRLLGEEVQLTQRINDATNRTKPGSALSPEALVKLEEKRTTLEYQRWRIEKERQKLRVRSPESNQALFREQNRLLTERARKVSQIAKIEEVTSKRALLQGRYGLASRAAGVDAIASKGRAGNLLKSANSIRPMMELFRGFRLANIGRGLLAFGKSILTVANGVRRFVFSVGGFTTILEVILLFGDKIPGIKDALISLGEGFSAFFSEIGKIGQMSSDAMENIFYGLGLYRSGNQEKGMAYIKAGVLELASIIKTQLANAWDAFFVKAGWVYDIFRKIVLTVMELGSLLVKSIGAVIDSIGKDLELWSTWMPDGDIGGWMKNFAKGVGSLITWSGYFILELKDALGEFIYNLQMGLAQIFPSSGWGKGSNMWLFEQQHRERQAYSAYLKKRLTMENEEFRKKIDEIMSFDSAANAQRNIDLRNGIVRGKGRIPLYSSESLKEELLKNGGMVDKGGLPPAMQQALKVISAFVSSAAQSRGNLVRAMSAEKQTQEAIKANTKKTADGIEELAKNGGQLVFTS